MASRPKPICIYTRISREDADDPSASPANQLRACEDHLERVGLKQGEHFEDRDISAYNPKKKRDHFEAMMKRVEAGEFGGIIVWKLDRLTRQLAQYWPILTRIKDAGAQLISVTESIDTSSIIGQNMVAFIIGQAEQASLDTSKRVKLSEVRRAEDGQPHGGGHRSFGYKWVPDPKTDNKKMKLVVVPAEEKLIKKIVAKLTAGESAREVARWLNAEGVKTTTINKKTGEPRQWSHETIRTMLRSPKLIGERVHNGERFPSKHIPAILTEAEINAALEANDRGHGYRGSVNRVANKYLLSGTPTLIHCSNCKGPMYPTDKVVRYQCKNEDHKCGRSINTRQVDQFVYLCAVEYAEQHQAALDQVDKTAEARAVAETAKDGILKTISEVTAAKWRENDPEIRATFDLTIEGLKGDLAQVRERISELEIQASKKVSRIRGMGQPLRLTEMADRRIWLRLWVSKVWIDASPVRGGRFNPKRIRIDWNYGEYEPNGEDDEAQREYNRIVEAEYPSVLSVGEIQYLQLPCGPEQA